MTRLNRRLLLLAGLGLVARCGACARGCRPRPRPEAASSAAATGLARRLTSTGKTTKLDSREVPVRNLLAAGMADTARDAAGGVLARHRWLAARLQLHRPATWPARASPACMSSTSAADRQLWFGSVLQAARAAALKDAAQPDEALGRVKDVRFALDRLLAGAWRADRRAAGS